MWGHTRLAHVLVDDYISQVIDMEMSRLIMWMYDMRLDWPNTRNNDFSLHNVYAVSLDLRLSHVLKMGTDLLRRHQMMLRNWVVIKVVLRFVEKYAVRHGQSRICPFLFERDISASSSVNQGFWITASRKRLWGKGNSMYMRLWWLFWYDLCVHMGVDTSW